VSLYVLTLVSKQKTISAVEYFYIRLILQSSFSLIVMFVCTVKILTAPETDGQKPVYWSALTGTAASWLPSPTPPAKKEDDTTLYFEGDQNNIERKPPE
jgi:hypothetical protein